MLTSTYIILLILKNVNTYFKKINKKIKNINKYIWKWSLNYVCRVMKNYKRGLTFFIISKITFN